VKLLAIRHKTAQTTALYAARNGGQQYEPNARIATPRRQHSRIDFGYSNGRNDEDK
jgi:hypothetical protein